MVERVALYPGTFDPVTNGHLDVIGREAQLRDGLAPLELLEADEKQGACQEPHRGDLQDVRHSVSAGSAGGVLGAC